jgi:hypothetical protein
MRDVLNDPTARVALAQSLNARFFVFGGMRHTASFDVTAHMVDAQTGAKTGGGQIHVQDHAEMKLRMQELVNQATGTPAQAKQLAQDGKDSEKALNDARRLLQAGKYAEAGAAAAAGLQKYANNVALQTVQTQADRQVLQARLEEARRQEAARQAAQAEAARRQQIELTKQAEAASLRAKQEAQARDAAAKRAQEAQKQRAFDNLVAQARGATKAGSARQAVSFYDSALALKQEASVSQERDQAKAAIDQATKAQAEAEAKKQREAALAAARQKVEDEKKKREAEETEKRKDQDARDAVELAHLIDQAKASLAKGQYDAALGALQTARRLKKSDEVEKLVAQVQEAQARAEAEKKGQQAKADLEKKLAAEKAARDKADAETKQKQQAYQAALTEAQKAYADKRYDQAVAKYQQAGELFRTDAVLAGIKQAQDARAREAAPAKEQQQQAEKVRQLVATGRSALGNGQHDAAAKAFGEAHALAPKDPAVVKALQDLDAAKASAAAQTDRKKREADYQAAMKSGRDAYTAKRFDDAVRAFGDALRLMPGDRDATALQQQATKARDDAKAAADAEAKRKAEFTRLMNQGQTAMAAKRYAEAVRAYGDALKQQPGDAAAMKGQRDAQQALDAAKPPAKLVVPMKPAVPAKPEAPPPKPAAPAAPMPSKPVAPPAEYTKQMDAAAGFEKQQKYADAVTAYRAALKAVPNDARATKALDFAEHMADGQKALSAKKFPDAVREFEAALKMTPGHADATALLKRAKEGKP